MEQTADLFEKLNSQRTDFVHSNPITNKSKKQILHRRKDKAGKYFEVDSAYLDQFIKELHDVSSGLYEIRKAVKTDL
jgi:sulfatase maturation enzyme AslB (radical SAM superfamily)